MSTVVENLNSTGLQRIPGATTKKEVASLEPESDPELLQLVLEGLRELKPRDNNTDDAARARKMDGTDNEIH